jgi:hypothetical protein
MSNRHHNTEIMDEKLDAAHPPVVSDDELKGDTIVVDDEEEKAILKKINLQ